MDYSQRTLGSLGTVLAQAFPDIVFQRNVVYHLRTKSKRIYLTLTRELKQL